MLKKLLKNLVFLTAYRFGLTIRKRSTVISQIGHPAKENYLSLSELNLKPCEQAIVKNFRTDRYYWLNEYRWRLLAKTGISFEEKVIFEPGAGIGDQTAWLLQQGAAKVIASDGRASNVEICKKRFSKDSRVTNSQWDLEQPFDFSDVKLKSDIVYLWGVYYHILDSISDFPVLNKLSTIAPIIVMDFQMSLTGIDHLRTYKYNTASSSVSHHSWAQTLETMALGIRSNYGHAYFPIEQMNWDDPATLSAPRRIIIGSKLPLYYPGLVKA